VEHDTSLRSRIDRRAFLRHTGAAAAATVALGVGAGAWLDEPPPAEAATTLTLWGFAPNRQHWLKSLVPGFRKLYPQADIKYVNIPYDQLWPKLTTAFLGGTGIPDMVDIEVGAMGQFTKGGTVPFVPLNQYLGSRKSMLIASAAYAPWTFQGNIYGIGNEYNPVLMYYRWDLFQKAGINPASIKMWSDYVKAGKQLKAKTGVPMAGLPVADASYWYFIARQRGGGFFDTAGHIIVNNAIGVSSLQFLVDLIYKHKIAIIGPGGSDEYQATYYTALSNGAFATAIGAPWYQGFMKDSVPKGSGKWEIMPYPRWDAHSKKTVIFGGTGLGITQAAKDKDLCWKFIEYCMLRPENQYKGFLLENLYPDVVSLYGRPALQKPDPYFHNQRPGKFLQEVADSAAGWILNPYQTEMGDAWLRLLPPVMQGKESAKTGLDKIAADVAKKMKG
jgi:arabinosaccharide transport system substrate-binding protein